MSMNSGARHKQKIAKKREKARKQAAEIQKRSLVIPTIFMDESGNTGANLIDKQQPFFTMAGTNFSEREAERLLALVDSKSTKEVHFSVLKRRSSGQDAVVRMLKHSLINRANVKVCVIHKPFMVTSKIVDTLIEHQAFETGSDLYKDGHNIALSNMLHYCLPAFCGEAGVEMMQERFIDMVRERTPESISAFYESVENLKKTCSKSRFLSDLNLIIGTKSVINGALKNIDKSTLDPLIPTLFNQFIEWGKEYPRGFHVIHDESKTLVSQKELFEEFMTEFNGKEIELGYDRRKFTLPLKGKSLKFGKSHDYCQLQVADVVASAVSYWASGVARGEENDEFFKKLNQLDLRKLIISVIWPTKDVTPESLDTVHDGGMNAADGGAYFLMEARVDRSRASGGK
ncbi:DUF3800 domain-containing protein [Achromobacter spanius]|uniref:DUF3800 domain-containing protein n=1 Tax=Achromobacter spanius TaxID=217203 RepID=A0AAW3HVK5_9BURK|nr:DUF3800 domain-containing protein [Achromobacter spanius]KNE22727.1 hypothetical protein AFM18_29015 [Achromobacter spanius]